MGFERFTGSSTQHKAHGSLIYIFVHQQCMASSGLGKMHLDLYTQNAGLTHKAKFWCNYVSALKGSQDLRAPDQTIFRTIHPSIVETLPDTFPELKHEFSKLESQMFDKPKRPGLTPLTPVLPDAHDRIFSPGYVYNPVHTFMELTEHKLKEVYCKKIFLEENDDTNLVFLK